MATSAAPTKLQLALDDIDRDAVLPLLEQVAGSVDIVEVGTPLVIRYGLALVREISSRFPQLEVLCDAKIMDAAKYEAGLCFEAGAHYVTVLGVTDDGSIRGCVEAAREHGRKVVADLICVSDLATRGRQLCDLGVDVLAVHTGVDQQAQGRTPLDDLRTLAAAQLPATLAVAGGINRDTVADYLRHDPEIVIVGGGILGAPNPVAEAAALHDLLEGPRA